MPWWLFKKSQSEEPVAETPTAVTYSIGEEETEKILNDSSHKEAADYQAAMALFGNENPRQKPMFLAKIMNNPVMLLSLNGLPIPMAITTRK